MTHQDEIIQGRASADFAVALSTLKAHRYEWTHAQLCSVAALLHDAIEAKTGMHGLTAAEDTAALLQLKLDCCYAEVEK